MIARMAGTVILSGIVFIFVTLLVGYGVSWWTGGSFSGAVVGVIFGLAAAFAVGAVSSAVGQSEERTPERLGDENNRSSDGSTH